MIYLETQHDHPGLLHGRKSRGFFKAGRETAFTQWRTQRQMQVAER